MRRFFDIASLVALVGLAVFTFVTAVSPVRPLSDGRWFTPPYDFTLRMTEIKCLKQGVDPFKVWNNEVVLPPFYPNYQSKVSGPEFTEVINAYAPWEYAMMLPFSYLPPRVAWGIYFGLMMVCLAALALCVGRREGVFVGCAAVLAIAYPAWSNVCIGNFSVVVLAAVALMAWALDRHRPVLAGFCWAVAMLKPQLGIAFAIPLLLRREWKTCFVAAGLCLALSLVPAAMCHTSPLELILETPAANAFCFKGCGTWPPVLCGMLGNTGDILAALTIGALLCVMLTRMLPRQSSWLVFLMPAAICATTWTYASTYGHVLNWFMALVLLKALWSHPHEKSLWVLCAFAAVSCTRLYDVYHASVAVFSAHYPSLIYPESVHLHLDSINSTVDYVLMAVLCLKLRRRS